MAAVAIVFCVGVSCMELLQTLFGAETAIGCALFHQKLSIFFVNFPTLSLDIGAYRAAHIGAFIVVKTAVCHGPLDNGHCVLDLPLLIGVFDTKNEIAAGMPGDKVGVKCSSQIAHMHIAGGAGAKRVRTRPWGIRASISSK